VINTFNEKPATLSLGTGELSPAMEEPAGPGRGHAHHVRAACRREAGATPMVGGAQADERAGRPDEQYAGDVVQFPTPDGRPSAGAVVQVREDGAVLFDFNHPLAGQPVTFEVKLIGVL
jgi:FKBP-type peptidyl-prolyl cis-trans isomerase SlpA